MYQVNKEVRRKYFREVWYPKNKKRQLELVAQTRLRLTEFVNNLKDKPCADCGNKFHPAAMDFDHINGEKIANISTMASNGTKDKLIVELKKCELVCSNCHRIRTYNRGVRRQKE